MAPSGAVNDKAYLFRSNVGSCSAMPGTMVLKNRFSPHQNSIYSMLTPELVRYLTGNLAVKQISLYYIPSAGQPLTLRREASREVYRNHHWPRNENLVENFIVGDQRVSRRDSSGDHSPRFLVDGWSPSVVLALPLPRVSGAACLSTLCSHGSTGRSQYSWNITITVS